MSLDVELHGVPAAITAADIAASLVLWCGTEIATLHAEPTLHVVLRGRSRVEDPWRDGRAIEVFRPSPSVAWLTLRHADTFTSTVARGFSVWWCARFGEPGARAEVDGTVLV